MTGRVTLRPVSEDDLPLLRRLAQDPGLAGEFELYGWLLPEARNHGYGTQAHRLLVRYLFAHTTVHRIEAATEVGNIAEQKVLEKAGFSREGVLRGIRWRGGAWRDEVLYSILRSDPPA